MSGVPIDVDFIINSPEFKAEISRVKAEISGVARVTQKESEQINRYVKKIASGMGMYFSAGMLKDLVREIASVRGEFQQLEVALETILKSKPKADALMAEVVNFAATTPFQLKDVAKGTKQLLAYQFATEDIIGTMRMLGDVSSGVSAPIGDLVYLYGTLKTQGRAYTRDIMQFTSRGIPIITELAKVMGVADNQISKLVESGAIGFKEVEKAFQNMTNEGGIFAGLMEKQSKTITGLASNFGDAWTRMLNDIGQGQEGLIANTIKGTTNLVNNYEQVVDILKVLIATYGIYKAATVASVVATKAMTAAGNVKAWLDLAKGIKTAKDAQLAFNLATKASPYGLALAGITAIAGAILYYNKHAQDSVKITSEFKDELDKELGGLKSSFQAVRNAKEGKGNLKTAIEELNTVYGDYLPNQVTEKTQLEDLKTAQDAATEALAKNIALKSKESEIAKIEEIASKKRKAYQDDINDLKGWAELSGEQYGKVAAEMDKLAHDLSAKDLDFNNVDYNFFRNKIKEVLHSNDIDITAKGKGGSISSTMVGNIATHLRKAVEANQIEAESVEELNTVYSTYLETLGLIKKTKPGEGGGTDNKPRTVKTIEAEIDALKTQQKELSTTKTQYEEYAKKIASLEKELEGITGKSKNKKSSSNNKKTFKQELDEQRKQYELYKKWAIGISQEAADEQFSSLLEKGKTFKAYLNNQISKIERKENRTNSDNNNLAALKNSLAELNSENALSTFKANLQNSVENADSLGEALEGLKDDLSELENDDTELGLEKRKVLQEQINELEKRTAQQNAANFTKLLANTMTYDLKRKSIESRFAADKKQLEKNQTKFSKREYSQRLKQLNENKRDAIQAIKEEEQYRKQANFEQTESFRELTDFIYNNGKSSLLKRLKQIDAALEKAKEAYGEESDAYKNLVADINAAKVGTLEGKFGEVRDVLFAATDAAAAFDDELGESIATVAELADGVMNLAEGAAKIYAGDVAGGITSALQGVAKIATVFKRVKNSYKEARAELEKFLLAQELAEMRIAQNQRESLRATQQIGETALEYQKRITAELEKQSKVNQNEYDELLKRIQGEEYFIKRVGDKNFLGIRTGAKTIKDYHSMLGMSYNDILQKYESGRLDESVAKLFEQLQALKEEGEDIDAMLESGAEAFRESWTGSTADGIVESIVSGFEEGYSTAADFADTFEELMKKAVLESLKMQYLSEPLREWYEQFADYSQSGGALTPDEIADLQAKYNQIIDDAAMQFETLKGVTGFDFSAEGTDVNSLSGSIKGVTEETASVLSGQINAIRMHQQKSYDLAASSLKVLAKIEANTKYNSFLESIDKKLGEIKNSNDELRANGL